MILKKCNCKMVSITICVALCDLSGLGLALAFNDGTIQILHRLSLQTMGVFPGTTGSSQRVGDEPTIKRQRTGGPTVHFKALQFSWTSLALVGVDNHGKVHEVKLETSRLDHVKLHH